LRAIAPQGIIAVLCLAAALLTASACTLAESFLVTSTPTPAPPSGALLEERLPQMLLQQDDLPPGFVAWSESYQRNEDILARAGGDPEVVRSLRNSGRQTGYVAVYQAMDPTDVALEGIFVILELYDRPEQASTALYRDPRQVAGTAMRPVTIDPLADESLAYTATSQDSALYSVWFRKDRLTAAVFTSSVASDASVEEAHAFAQRLLAHVQAAGL